MSINEPILMLSKTSSFLSQRVSVMEPTHTICATTDCASAVAAFEDLHRLETGLDDVETYVEKSLPMLEYTFALLLEGYYKTLELCHERSVRRGEQRDGNRYPYESHRHRIAAALGQRVDRLTAKDWDTALKLAFEARAFFQRAAELRSEEAAETGLDLLFQSLRAWPSQEGFRLLLPSTVETLASTCLQRRRQRFVPDPDLNWRPQFPGVFPQSAPASDVLPTNQAMRAQVVEKFWEKAAQYSSNTVRARRTVQR
ncbi:hypothetical protein C8J57DRAFT_657374 [Mycena rebaudengoi]|nr:hypothetical protein C8J57DRAFT_657374 [Mycena rebaudengoi]